MKVLIVYNKIHSYRVKIFELLNRHYDLTVSYSDPAYINKKYIFKTVFLPVKKLGPFEYHLDNLHKIASQYDVVIGISNLRWISLVRLVLRRKRNYKLGYWGIGVTASYENKFDSKNTWDRIRFFISKRSDFTIFYCSYPVDRYINAGVPIEKLFVANNTCEVHNDGNMNINEKRNFLFIGTLYKEKGLDLLLKSFHELYKVNKLCPLLYIIGDGPERRNTEMFIEENGLQDKVKLLGSIYDKKVISSYFDVSVACISPKQAGLSVLTSMGNGTIFVTEEDAITGGEIFDIENKVNGIILKEGDSLTDVMSWIVNNPMKVAQMNLNALEFYRENRTPSMMANELKNAIRFSLNN